MKLLDGADLTGRKATNVADPTSAQDAATKAYADSRSARILAVVFDGGGIVLTTGAKNVMFTAPITGTITKWRIVSLNGITGSVVIDIWKDSYANFPPVVGDTITASAKPTVSSATKAESTTLTGWTTTMTAGDIYEFNIDSVTAFTKIRLELFVTPT